MKRFLIFGLPRSGTTSLAALLHSRVAVVHEPFNEKSGALDDDPEFIALLEKSGWMPEQLPGSEDPSDPWAWNRLSQLVADERTFARYLERLYGKFTGIKHVWPSQPPEANQRLLDWCHYHGVRLIFQTRKRIGQALLSEFLARQSGIWQMGPDLEQRQDWRSSEFEAIDVESFANRLDHLQSEQEGYLRHIAGRPHFALSYEDLYLGFRWRRRRTLRNLLSFLDASLSEFDRDALGQLIFNRKRKQTRSSTLRKLPNYAELKPYL